VREGSRNRSWIISIKTNKEEISHGVPWHGVGMQFALSYYIFYEDLEVRSSKVNDEWRKMLTTLIYSMNTVHMC
jgi:hypothetical protein